MVGSVQHAIRTLPDTTIANALTAAYGRPVRVEADPLGHWAALRLPSGRSLVLAVVGSPGQQRLFSSVGVATRDGVDIDGLADLRLDLEVLAAAGEICELYVTGRLNARAFEWAASCAGGCDDEEVAEFAIQQARALELDLGDGEVPAPGACLVELALALHRLAQLAEDNAPEVVEVDAVEVDRA